MLPNPAPVPELSVVVVADPYQTEPLQELEAFFEQTLAADRYELIFVDCAGQLRVEPLLAARPVRALSPRVTCLVLPTRSRAVRTNAGVAAARAPVVLLLADDFVPGPRCFAAHLEHHTVHPEATRVGIGASLGPERLREASPFLRWLEDSGELFGVDFRRAGASLPEGFFYAGNASLKRSLFLDAGGFDERFLYPAFDDEVFRGRLRELGMVSELVPDATCVHEHLVTFRTRRQQMRWAGSSAAESARAARAGESGALGFRGADSPSRRELLVYWLGVLRQDGPRVTAWRFALRWEYRRAFVRRLRDAAHRPGSTAHVA